MKKNKLKVLFLLAILIAEIIVIVSIVIDNNSLNKHTIQQITNKSMSDKEIIDMVVDNFMIISKVPRPSHHEEKISSFLINWAKNEGLNPVKDSVNNVMFDVPATKGMEDKPLGILQVHMDMVVAVADGKEFDPLNDVVTVIRNENDNTLTAEGTSLGGDDGAGIAIVMGVVQGKMKHGPLRIIITVNEEDGMTGAFNVSRSWLEGASFLINVDNEVSDEVLVSTASCDTIKGDKKLSFTKTKESIALNIGISNLKGGHSGVEIDKGRLNGIVGLASFLKELDKEKIEYNIASFEGGTAANAIPTKSSAVLVVSSKNKTIIEQKIKEYVKKLNEKYKDIENEIKYTVKVLDEVPNVISEQEKHNMIKFITEIIDGVYTWSTDMQGLVESSSNLGIFKLNKDGISFVTLIRSSSAIKEVEILNSEIQLTKTFGYNVSAQKTADAWPYDPDSNLLALAKKVYKDQNGKEINVSAVHAGVECGTFKSIKPNVDMISIGPDLTDGHTINETLYLNSIPKVWRLLEGILEEYPRVVE